MKSTQSDSAACTRHLVRTLNAQGNKRFWFMRGAAAGIPCERARFRKGSLEVKPVDDAWMDATGKDVRFVDFNKREIVDSRIVRTACRMSRLDRMLEARNNWALKHGCALWCTEREPHRRLHYVDRANFAFTAFCYWRDKHHEALRDRGFKPC